MENLSLPEWTLNLSDGGRPYFWIGERDDRKVFVELLLELFHVAHVIHALVKPARELRRDGLKRNLLVRQRGQNDQQFRRRLRAVGFVHRNFRDEVFRALGRDDVLVDFPGVLHGEQKLARHALDFRAGDLKRTVNVREWKPCR